MSHTSWTHNDNRTLLDAVERILDKGVVINADISVSLVGIELLGIKIRASLASFETAARFGMEFPAGTNLNAVGWRELEKMNDTGQQLKRPGEGKWQEMPKGAL